MGFKMKGSSFFTGKDNGGCSRVSSPFKQSESDFELLNSKQYKDLSEANKQQYQKNLRKQYEGQGKVFDENLIIQDEKRAESKKVRDQKEALGDSRINPKTGEYDVPAESSPEQISELNRRNKNIKYDKEVADVKSKKAKTDKATALDETNKATLEASRTTAEQTELLEKEKGERDRAEFEGDEGTQSQKSKRLNTKTTKVASKRVQAEGKTGLIARMRAKRLAKKEDRVSDKRDQSEAFDKLSAEDKKKYKRGTLKNKEKQTGEAKGKRSKADRRLAIQNAANLLAK